MQTHLTLGMAYAPGHRDLSMYSAPNTTFSTKIMIASQFFGLRYTLFLHKPSLTTDFEKCHIIIQGYKISQDAKSFGAIKCSTLFLYIANQFYLICCSRASRSGIYQWPAPRSGRSFDWDISKVGR